MKPNKSQLFRVYNHARAVTRENRQVDSKRLDKAFGIVQRASTILLPDGRLDVTASSGPDFYLASWQDCQCADIRRHGAGWWCKHRLAALLVVRLEGTLTS